MSKKIIAEDIFIGGRSEEAIVAKEETVHTITAKTPQQQKLPSTKIEKRKIRELKTEKVNLLIEKSVLDKVVKLADKNDFSLNHQIGLILKEHLLTTSRRK